MIRFTHVSLMRGTKTLFDNVDLTLNPGDKIGLIGSNGAGKSTLFAMLRNELHSDQGEIDFPTKWRMAHHDPEQFCDSTRRAALCNHAL